MQNHNYDADSVQIERVHRWIERLEGKAVTMVDGLEFQEMTPKHQADVALKFLDHVLRLTLMEKKLQDAAQANEEQGLLNKLMSAARGELELSEVLDNEQTITNILTAGAGVQGLAPARLDGLGKVKMNGHVTEDEEIERSAMIEENRQKVEIDEEDEHTTFDKEFLAWVDEQSKLEEDKYAEYEEPQEDEDWWDDEWYL